jgi:hypothetical protein
MMTYAIILGPFALFFGVLYALRWPYFNLGFLLY